MNDQSNSWIGKRTIRPDGADKVTGRAAYAIDAQARLLAHANEGGRWNGIEARPVGAHADWIEVSGALRRY